MSDKDQYRFLLASLRLRNSVRTSVDDLIELDMDEDELDFVKKHLGKKWRRQLKKDLKEEV